MAVSPIHIGLDVAQALTFIGFVLTVAGLSALQKQANSLNIADIQDARQKGAAVASYDSTFTAGLLNPYPFNTGWQFEYQWFAVWFEFFIFTWITVLIMFPAYILRLKPTALSFISAALVLVFENVNAVLFFKRSDAAKRTFGHTRITVTLAGLIVVGIGNGLMIIFLGLTGTGSDRTGIDEAEAHERDKGRLSDVTGHEKRAVGNPGTIKTDSAQQVPREDVESHPV